MSATNTSHSSCGDSVILVSSTNVSTNLLTYLLSQVFCCCPLQVPANHLLSASFMSAPAALAISKLFYPETEKSKTTVKDVKKLAKGCVRLFCRCFVRHLHFWFTLVDPEYQWTVDSEDIENSINRVLRSQVAFWYTLRYFPILHTLTVYSAVVSYYASLCLLFPMFGSMCYYVDVEGVYGHRPKPLPLNFATIHLISCNLFNDNLVYKLIMLLYFAPHWGHVQFTCSVITYLL